MDIDTAGEQKKCCTTNQLDTSSSFYIRIVWSLCSALWGTSLLSPVGEFV